MNGGAKDEGLEYKRPRRLKCDRRNFRQPHPYLYTFFNFGTRWKWVVNTTPHRSLVPPEIFLLLMPIRIWVDARDILRPAGLYQWNISVKLSVIRAGVDRWGKSRAHRNSIPGPSSPQPVAIPTEILGPQSCILFFFLSVTPCIRLCYGSTAAIHLSLSCATFFQLFTLELYFTCLP
jgi:hypothetical protein